MPWPFAGLAARWNSSQNSMNRLRPRFGPLIPLIMATASADNRTMEWLRSLPAQFRSTVEGVSEEIRSRYPGVQAIVVVGSTAENHHTHQSDVDVLFVRDEAIDKCRIREIKDRWPLAHFIVWTPDRLRDHFENATVMAWSVMRGRVLYDPKGIITPLISRPLGPPSKTWLRDRAKYVDHWPDDVSGLARTMVNFSILYLSSLGMVPTTKRQIQQEFDLRISDESLQAALLHFSGMRWNCRARVNKCSAMV